jgi:hypothetical protein
MKKALGLLIIPAMIGCSNIAFDNMQFDRHVNLYNKLTTIQNHCDDISYIRTEIPDIKKDAQQINSYSQFRINSPEVKKATEILHSFIIEFSDRYEKEEPSKLYCEEKTKSMVDASFLITSTLGAQ